MEKPVELQNFGKAFPKLSCVSSSCFHQKVPQHIVNMQKAFLQCVVTKWTFKLFQHPPQHPWPPPALPRLPLPIKFLGVANVRVAIVRKNGVANVTKIGVADVTKIGVADVRMAIVTQSEGDPYHIILPLVCKMFKRAVLDIENSAIETFPGGKWLFWGEKTILAADTSLEQLPAI